MTDKQDITQQNKLAFDFIEKLYLEVSYLIKEVEGILNGEEERFIIGKPSGYGITRRGSSGLGTNDIRLWLLRKLAVSFIPEDKTKGKGGQTITPITSDLKVLYLRLILYDNDINEPLVYSGVLRDFVRKSPEVWIKKFENLMGHIEYTDEKVFKDVKNIQYEDAYIKFGGQLIINSLFDIDSSQAVKTKLVEPMLEIFRKS